MLEELEQEVKPDFNEVRKANRNYSLQDGDNILVEIRSRESSKHLLDQKLSFGDRRSSFCPGGQIHDCQ